MFAWGPCRERHEGGLWTCCVPVTSQNTQGGLREQGRLAPVSYQAGRIHPFEPPLDPSSIPQWINSSVTTRTLAAAAEMLMGMKSVVGQGEAEQILREGGGLLSVKMSGAQQPHRRMTQGQPGGSSQARVRRERWTKAACFGRLGKENRALRMLGKGAHTFLTHRQPQNVLGGGQGKSEPLGVVAHSLEDG